MPSSQLSQLKAALSSAGVNRKSTSKKDKKAWKKGGAREVDRAKTAAKLEDIRKGLNKFDVRETKVGRSFGSKRSEVWGHGDGLGGVM
jgi:nucleolar protein 14